MEGAQQQTAARPLYKTIHPASVRPALWSHVPRIFLHHEGLTCDHRERLQQGIILAGASARHEKGLIVWRCPMRCTGVEKRLLERVPGGEGTRLCCRARAQ